MSALINVRKQLWVYGDTRNPGEMRDKLNSVAVEHLTAYLSVKAVLPRSADRLSILNHESARAAIPDVDRMATLIDQQRKTIEEVLDEISSLTTKDGWPGKS